MIGKEQKRIILIGVFTGLFSIAISGLFPGEKSIAVHAMIGGVSGLSSALLITLVFK
jgi:hypothetical protein